MLAHGELRLSSTRSDSLGDCVPAETSENGLSGKRLATAAQGLGDLRIPIMLADAAGADKVGHHLKIAWREARGDAFTARIQLILGYPVLSAGIYGQRVVLVERDQRLDAPGRLRTGCLQIVTAEHP